MKKKLPFFRSLKFRILVILVIIGIAPEFIVTAVIVRSYTARAVELRTMNVKNQCDILVSSMAASNALNGTDTAIFDSQLSTMSNVYNGRLLVVDSDFRIIKDTYDLDVGKISMAREVISCFQSKSGNTNYDSKNKYIVVTEPIRDKDTRDLEGVLVASVSTNEIYQTAVFLEERGILVSCIVGLFVLIVGYFLSEFLVRPFQRVTHAIEEVTDGYENEMISVPDYTETVQITNAFNQMLKRVQALDNSRQEFVSNVSHELKTPLTSMKVLADSLNSAGEVPVEVYKEFMGDITKEIDRENDIIQDLLSMVRMNGKAAKLNLEKTEIGGMLEQVIQRLKPIAQKRNIELIMNSYKPVTAEIDQTKLSLAFSNLIENGIKYNIDGGWVRVSLHSDHKYFYVSVADCGLGIPEDQLDHIFERFYRGDKSHSTTIEGTGLGLSITQAAIKLHHGVIKVSSKVKEGTTFMVRIPLVHPES